MPSWKKIILSGSDAALNSLNVTTSITASVISASQFTGSLFGTSSWAFNAITASFASSIPPILGIANSIAYYQYTGVNSVLTSSNYIKTYYDGASAISNWSFRVGRQDPDLVGGTSGSHILKDGVELFTNAKAVVDDEPFVILGFGKKNSMTLSGSLGYEHPGIDTYDNGLLIPGNVYAGSLKLQQSFYGIQQAGEIKVYSKGGFVVQPSSPGFLLGNGGFYIFESASMQFNVSGALISPPSSASVKFTLGSDSSSLSLSVGKNDLREILFISRSGNEPRIGVGKSNPRAALDISGSVIITGSLTASGDLNIKGFPSVSASLASLASGVGTLQQVTDAGNTTTNAISSSFAGVGFYGTASWAINVVNGGGGGGGGSDSAFLDQSTPAVTWSFAHNLGTQYPVITIYDTNGQVIIPQEIDGEDTNNLKIYFPTSQSGYATAVGGTSALTYYSQSLTTASVNLNTITFTKGDSSTFDIVVNTGSIPTLQQVTTQGASTTIPITASIISASSFTGSLFGTASWAVSASRAITSSFALTASYVNPLLQNVIITGSLLVTQSSISVIDYIDFTTTATPAFQEGRVNWVDDTKTLAIDTELNGFQIEVGHQNVIRVRNETGITISRGRVVYLSGSSGNRPLIYTSSYEIDPTSAGTVGLVAADIGSSNNGYVISNGLIRDVDTTAFNAGAVLYLSSSGQLSTTAPVAPLHAVRMGKVITSAVAGIIHVDVDNGYEIGELHDVVDTSTNSSYGDLLVKSGSVWKSNRQLTGSYGLTGSLSATSFTGSLFGTASWANNATTSSYALTASYTPNSVVEFTNQSTWTFNHNLNNRYVIVQTLDSNHNQIIPQNIYHQDNNVVVITFPTSESGYAIAR